MGDLGNRIEGLLGDYPEGEPRAGIYNPLGSFVKARERLKRQGKGWKHRPSYEAVLQFFEIGWLHFRPLQLVCETHPEWNLEADDARAMCAFVEVELVDTFRWFAFSCADFIPGAKGRKPDLAELEAEVEVFQDTINVAKLAALGGVETVPEALREVVLREAENMLRWAIKLDDVVDALGKSLPWNIYDA